MLVALLLVACTEYEVHKSKETEVGEDPPVESVPPPVESVPPEPETRVDTWDIDEAAGADMLFFGDTSGSMVEELTTMGEKITELVDYVSEYTEDIQLLAVTGPDGCGVGGVITPDSSDYATQFATGLMTPPGADEVDEWGLYNAAMAVENTDEGECNAGFLREEARLYVVFISDEDDNSPGYDGGDPEYWKTYTDSIGLKKGNIERVIYSAVTGPIPDGCTGAEPGLGYADAALATGGAVLSICDSWPSQVTLLIDISQEYDTFKLSQFPHPETLAVTVDGASRTTGWSYVDADNAVVFVDEIPTTGQHVEISYTIAY